MPIDPARVILRTSRRVEFCDTDMAGIVHFANFFRWMESAEVEFLRSLGLSVAVQAAVLEPLPGGTDGLGRSWSLTQGFKWRAFGLYVVVIVLVLLCLLGFAVLAGLAATLVPLLLVPAMIGFALVFLFLYPFTSCVFTLFYYDLRVRKEAFDLELLSRHLGIAAARA